MAKGILKYAKQIWGHRRKVLFHNTFASLRLYENIQIMITCWTYLGKNTVFADLNYIYWGHMGFRDKP